jgi:TAT (twin-arginine translocation) pathway signal sequence
MLSRRNFLQGSMVVAATPLHANILQHWEAHHEPLMLRTGPPKCVFYLHEDADFGCYRIVTDALPFPRRLIKPEALARVFPRMEFRALLQRDHWRMIDEGHFGTGDLFQPCLGDGFYSA